MKNYTLIIRYNQDNEVSYPADSRQAAHDIYDNIIQSLTVMNQPKPFGYIIRATGSNLN